MGLGATQIRRLADVAYMNCARANVHSDAKPSSNAKSNNNCGHNSTLSNKDGGNVQDVPTSGQIVTPNLKIFTFAELKSATKNFSVDVLDDEGGFGIFFKGWVNQKTYSPSKVGVGKAVAIKRLGQESMQGPAEGLMEVEILGKFSHPNIVKLLGYYCGEDILGYYSEKDREFFLVYEYMLNGKSAKSLPWDTRLNIAVGTARGLSFLHATENQVIVRDIKSKNILLDGDFNAKLSGFGCAKRYPENGESHVSTRVIGTYGYAVPEYIATGNLLSKFAQRRSMACNDLEEILGIGDYLEAGDEGETSVRGWVGFEVMFLNAALLANEVVKDAEMRDGEASVNPACHSFGVEVYLGLSTALKPVPLGLVWLTEGKSIPLSFPWRWETKVPIKFPFLCLVKHGKYLGYLYPKSDVYGFGVVLLELLTGLRVLDRNRPTKKINLVAWAKPLLPHKKNLRILVDPRLENDYPPQEAFELASLILQCLQTYPKVRPSMNEVLQSFEQINSIKKGNSKVEVAQARHPTVQREATPYKFLWSWTRGLGGSNS
ncbi:hypothetical protein LguiB_026170 [Lonicera macranthoides]